MSILLLLKSSFHINSLISVFYLHITKYYFNLYLKNFFALNFCITYIICDNSYDILAITIFLEICYTISDVLYIGSD